MKFKGKDCLIQCNARYIKIFFNGNKSERQKNPSRTTGQRVKGQGGGWTVDEGGGGREKGSGDTAGRG